MKMLIAPVGYYTEKHFFISPVNNLAIFVIQLRLSLEHLIRLLWICSHKVVAGNAKKSQNYSSQFFVGMASF